MSGHDYLPDGSYTEGARVCGHHTLSVTLLALLYYAARSSPPFVTFRHFHRLLSLQANLACALLSLHLHGHVAFRFIALPRAMKNGWCRAGTSSSLGLCRQRIEAFNILQVTTGSQVLTDGRQSRASPAPAAHPAGELGLFATAGQQYQRLCSSPPLEWRALGVSRTAKPMPAVALPNCLSRLPQRVRADLLAVVARDCRFLNRECRLICIFMTRCALRRVVCSCFWATRCLH